MRYLLLLLLPYILHLSITPVLASESALTASPAILESVLDQNKPTTTTITIQNNTNFPLPIKGSASAFLSTETISDDIKNTFNASRWFALDPADFILQPNEIKSIKVTITPPKDAEPGGHYATLYFRPLIPQEAVSSGGNISLARIGVLAMLIYPGDITTSLTQSQLTTPSWTSTGPITFWNSLTNTGNTHLLPLSTLTIKNIWGQVLTELQSPPSVILPGTNKSNNFVWNKKLGIGIYQATLTTSYGTDRPILTSNTVTTYRLPWQLTLITITILTFIYKIFIVNRRRLALAIRVLKGTYEPPEITQKNSRHHSRTRHGSRPPNPS